MSESDIEPGTMASIAAGTILLIFGVWFALTGGDYQAVGMVLGIAVLAMWQRFTAVYGHE